MNFWSFCINHGVKYMNSIIEQRYPEYKEIITVVEKYIDPKPIIDCIIPENVEDKIIISSIEETVKVVNKNIHKTHKQIVQKIEEERILKRYNDVEIEDMFPNSKRKLFRELK